MTKQNTNPYHIAHIAPASSCCKAKKSCKAAPKAQTSTATAVKLPLGFKSKWVSALRGTNYIQGFGKMYDPKTDSYDPIGVAHRIAGVPASAIAGREYPNKRFKFIPNVLTENSELVERITSFTDKGMNFKWTADYIERHL